MSVRMIFLAATFCVAVSGAANACDMKASDAAFKVGDYAKAQTLAAKGKSVICLQAQADAAFFQGKQQEAHRLYAKSWAVALDDAYDETKGSSKFWSGLEKTVGVLAMAGSLYAASEGVVTTDQASITMQQGQAIISGADEGFKEATGNVDYRKTVKATIKDLNVLARRESSSLQAINTQWSRLPGAGLARVHVNGHTCNAVRTGKGRYSVSYSCLAKAGLAHDKYVSIGSGLRPFELAKVSSQRQQGALMTLEVASAGDAEAEIASSEWTPSIYFGGSPERYAAVWHASELNHLVPVFQECPDQGLEGCGDIYGNSATLWVTVCVGPRCSWLFYGIAGTNGEIERLTK